LRRACAHRPFVRSLLRAVDALRVRVRPARAILPRMLGRLILVAVAATTLFFLGCSSDSGDSDDSGAGGSGVGGSGGAAGNVEPPDQLGMTDAHNAVRASVSPPADPPLSPLVWSDAMVAIAKAHADKCVWEHSMGDTGENLYASVGSPAPTPQSVVDSWASEIEFYDYASNGCTPGQQCGHYTQIVWRDTAVVGCAQVTCTVNSPFDPPFDKDPWVNWVCEYDPPGNWVGEKPY
jgi:pathogenesis-related protein 1